MWRENPFQHADSIFLPRKFDKENAFLRIIIDVGWVEQTVCPPDKGGSRGVQKTETQ